MTRVSDFTGTAPAQERGVEEPAPCPSATRRHVTRHICYEGQILQMRFLLFHCEKKVFEREGLEIGHLTSGHNTCVVEVKKI